MENHQSIITVKNKKIPIKQGLNYGLLSSGQISFIPKPSDGFTSGNNDVMINILKLKFKRFSGFFNIIYFLFGATFVGKSPKKFINSIGRDKIIMNLGSGVRRLRDDVIDVDIYPFGNIDILSDISNLPMADESVDVVVNEFVLEHVSDPMRIVREMKRVLKKDGLIYVAVPFVASFHSSPNDYYRWSKQGLRQMMEDFSEIECDVRCGPTSSLIYVLSEWLATVLSFGNRRAQQLIFMFFMIVFSPLSLVDYVIYKFPSSENIAYGFYFVGKKKS